MTNEERNIAIADMRRMKNEYMNGRKIDEVAERKCKSFEMAIKALEQQPCDKCVYSTKDGYCQYDDITETIPPLKPYGILIPDNATNGEIVQMIFPYYSYERNDYVQSTEDYIVDSMECMEHDLYFAYDWWNAPYQKGGKE